MQREIKQIISIWLAESVLKQKDLAQRLNMSAPSLNQMLRTDTPLPLGRFLQIAHILRPGADAVNRVFALYLDELNIPIEAMSLRVGHGAGVDRKSLRDQVHELVDLIPEDKLPALLPVLQIIAGEIKV